ncbi:hypothetical protein C0J52_18193 [Blattella germanica]|nr:hypothetical protein C0J52_18193 [Blattella germanica]
MEVETEMDPGVFYGRRKRRILLPPINPNISEGENSSDSEPEILANNSDDDPDYCPEVPSRKGPLLVPESESESESVDGDLAPEDNSHPQPEGNWGDLRDWSSGGEDQELYSLFKEPDIVKFIKIRRLEWAGHILCASEQRTVKTVPEGTRKIGKI